MMDSFSVYTILKSPDNGTLEMLDNQTGLVRYNPDDNFTGPDNFTYQATDNYSAISNEGVVFIDVTEGGVAPEPAYNVDNFSVTGRKQQQFNHDHLGFVYRIRWTGP